MDPNANLTEQLRIAERLVEATDNGDGFSRDDVARLAELVIALDEWIRFGGFLPAAWTRSAS